MYANGVLHAIGTRMLEGGRGHAPPEKLGIVTSSGAISCNV